MEEKIKISMLLEIYGKLLTEKQYNLLDDYYNKDLSLSEIAENEDITRQAVRDFLKKGEKRLFEFEEKLKFMEKNKVQEEKIDEILIEISKIENNFTDEKIVNVLDDIKNKIKVLV